MVVSQGLSPRVRGNRWWSPPTTRRQRSIPARAGEPTTATPPAHCSAVYPRACGGTVGANAPRCLGQGLSPRVRGNPTGHPDPNNYKWSIPARAGEPGTSGSPVPGQWVYPRACGGTDTAPFRNMEERGLSPRVRGNLVRCAPLPVSRGSIPARAGEPSNNGCGFCVGKVYPRACGGTLPSHDYGNLADGLSPRVRGNQCSACRNNEGLWSIPARAGEPPRLPRRNIRARVYPRACGGTTGFVELNLTVLGLSPRVRGNPPRHRNGHRRRRSIPARAGEPRSARTG